MLDSSSFILPSPSNPRDRQAAKVSSAGLLTYRLAANVFPKISVTYMFAPHKGRLTAAGKATGRCLSAGFCSGFSPDSLLISTSGEPITAAKIQQLFSKLIVLLSFFVFMLPLAI
jgi:hypothetical protein